MTRCDRCGRETIATTGSYFNTQIICLDCRGVEESHPDFDRARQRENEAVRRGDFNFAGVGLPAGYADFVRERATDPDYGEGRTDTSEDAAFRDRIAADDRASA